MVRWARRIAFTRFIRFFTEGFVKYALFLNSFKTPDRSYFFLNRLIARSIGSFSETTIPTKLSHLLQMLPAILLAVFFQTLWHAFEEFPFAKALKGNHDSAGTS